MKVLKGGVHLKEDRLCKRSKLIIEIAGILLSFLMGEKEQIRNLKLLILAEECINRVELFYNGNRNCTRSTKAMKTV